MATNDIKLEKKTRFRSPPYPAFDLEKAVERAGLLLEMAHHHEVGVTTLNEAWGMTSVGGKVWRSAAALIQYNLLLGSGTSQSRKFKITNIARRIIQDTEPNSEKRKNAVKVAALAPMIHKELWETFGSADGLADSLLKTYLTTDRAENGAAPYSASAAEEVVSTYRATLAYAGYSESGSVTAEVQDKGADTVVAKVGDSVKWTSNGVVQFDARKVDWVSDDGSCLRAFGGPKVIPMTEVDIVSPAVKPVARPPEGPKAGDDIAPKTAPDITVYQVGGRLQITADVDAAGIAKLKELLTKYEEILTLLN